MLLTWLGLEADAVSSDITCHGGARVDDMDDMVAWEGSDLPEDIRAFLQITDGLDIGELQVLGTRDLSIVDVDDRQHWVIAIEDDAYFLIASGGSTVVTVPSHDAKHPVNLAKSVPEWLRGRLTEA